MSKTQRANELSTALPFELRISRWKRFLVWTVCVLVFAYLPVWYTALRDLLRGSHEGIVELVKTGDILFIACAVTADGIGRAWLRLQQDRADNVSSSAIALAMLLLSTIVAVACVLIYAAGREIAANPDGVFQVVPMFGLTIGMVAVSAIASAIIVLAVEG